MSERIEKCPCAHPHCDSYLFAGHADGRFHISEIDEMVNALIELQEQLQSKKKKKSSPEDMRRCLTCGHAAKVHLPTSNFACALNHRLKEQARADEEAMREVDATLRHMGFSMVTPIRKPLRERLAARDGADIDSEGPCQCGSLRLPRNAS